MRRFWIDASGGAERRALALLAGDLAVLILFALIGRSTHDRPLAGALGTAAPFAAAWLVVAPLLGALHAGRTSQLQPMLRMTAVAWTAAFPVAAILRALFLWRASPASFYVVTYATILLMLAAWRAAFVLIEQRRRSPRPAAEREQGSDAG